MELGISTLKNNKIKIYADGEFLFTVPAVIWYSSRFSEGDDVTEEDLAELKNKAEPPKSYIPTSKETRVRVEDLEKINAHVWPASGCSVCAPRSALSLCPNASSSQI